MGGVCVCVCVCVYVCACSVVCDSTPEQWFMGVCVHAHAQSSPTLHWSSGIWVCVRMCTHVHAYSVMSNSLCQSRGVWLCVCVCVCLCSFLSDSLHQSSGVCVRELSHVLLFVPEQWHMGVHVCLCVSSVVSDSMHLSSGVGCVCVCVCAQSCLTLGTGAVVDGCVCVCV